MPAGSRLVFQIHYTPTGSPQQDLTRVGLVFADPDSVTEEVFTLIGVNRDFEIPPHAENHRVEMMFDKFPSGARLLAIAPHMHVRGRSFRFTSRQSDQRQVLLEVPQYDFNWQHAYAFEEPLPLDAGLQIECVAHFDNSENNPVNPDPTATVRWGDQTWQEMMLAYFEVAVPRDRDVHAGARQDGRTAEENARARRKAQQFVARFDKNGDRRIERDELPKTLARFAFDRLDRDDNLAIDEEEAFIEAGASARRRDSDVR